MKLENIDDWELVEKGKAKRMMAKVGLNDATFVLYSRKVNKMEYCILGLMANAKPVYFNAAK